MALNGWRERDLGPELTAIYKEFLKLTDQLEHNEIDPGEALRRVAQLTAEDHYGAVWSLDPETGTWRRTDHHGAVEANANPEDFMPKEGFRRREALEEDPVFDYGDRFTAPELHTRSRSKFGKKGILWTALAVVVALVAGLVVIGVFSGGEQEEAPTATATAEPRPTLHPGEGPSSDRKSSIVNALTSGDKSRVEHIVQGQVSDHMMSWTTTVFPSLVPENRLVIDTEHQVSVLQVVGPDNEVIMQGDLDWTTDGSGTWMLKELPLMAPIDETVTPATDVPVPTIPGEDQDDSDDSSKSDSSKDSKDDKDKKQDAEKSKKSDSHHKKKSSKKHKK